MRETAKSMLRFSWALSVFGLDQLGKLVRDEDAGHRDERIRAAFDSLSSAAGQQLGQRTRGLYDAGDKLGRESVDLLFDLVRLADWKPAKVVERTADLVERSAEALRDVARTERAKPEAPREPSVS